ncbi:hypothetical protein [Nonomuraea salmonea]
MPPQQATARSARWPATVCVPTMAHARSSGIACHQASGSWGSSTIGAI